MTIALNSSMDYTGGGTYFVDLGRALKIEQGHYISFPGNLRHGGDPITSGTRYILAMFLYVCDIDQEIDKSYLPGVVQQLDQTFLNHSKKTVNYSEFGVSQIFAPKHCSSNSKAEPINHFSFNFENNVGK